MIIRTYSELIKLPTFRERVQYLQLKDMVGRDTFGFDRYLNQMFYNRSQEWKRVRDYVITRDLGCDLAVPGYDIDHGVLIHHMNPITKEDIILATEFLLEPEYLITTILSTHNIIHYGKSIDGVDRIPIDRSAHDTCPWKR
jgi:hypothetical protein